MERFELALRPASSPARQQRPQALGGVQLPRIQSEHGDHTAHRFKAGAVDASLIESIYRQTVDEDAIIESIFGGTPCTPREPQTAQHTSPPSSMAAPRVPEPAASPDHDISTQEWLAHEQAALTVPLRRPMAPANLKSHVMARTSQPLEAVAPKRVPLAELLDGGGAPPAERPRATDTTLAVESRHHAAATQLKLSRALEASHWRVIDVFRKLDVDGSGEVDRDEFHRTINACVRELGGLSAADIDSAFDAFEHDASGRVSYAEFHRTLRRIAKESGVVEALACGANGRGGNARLGPTRVRSAPRIIPHAPSPSQASSQPASSQPPPPLPPPARPRPSRPAPLPAGVDENSAGKPSTGKPGAGKPGAGKPGAGKRAVAEGGDRRRTDGGARAAREQWSQLWQSSSQAQLPKTVHDVSLPAMKRREVLALLCDWRSQQQARVSRVESVRALLRMHFPTATKAELDRWEEWVGSVKAAKATEEELIIARETGVRDIFDALDADGNGTIELREFLQLQASAGISEVELREMFGRRDADAGGELDFGECVGWNQTAVP